MAWSLLDSGTAAFADGNTGHAFSYPAGAPADGNLLILSVNSDTTVSTPSGWSVATSDVQQQGAYLFYKIASSEGSSVTVTTNGNFNAALGFLRYSGNAASSPLDVTDKAAALNTLGTSTPALAGATLASSGELCVIVACLHGDDTGVATSPTASAGYSVAATSALQGSGGSATQAILATRTDGSGSQSPSVSWTHSFDDRTALFAAFLPTAGSNVDGAAAQTVTAGQTTAGAVDRNAAAAQTVTAGQAAAAAADRNTAVAQTVTTAGTATAGVDLGGTATQTITVTQAATATVDRNAAAAQTITVGQTAEVPTPAAAPLDIVGILNAVVSHALASGWFTTVNGHEPKNAPDASLSTGLYAAVWVQALEPAQAQSGLVATTARLVLNVRVYTSMLSEPQDAIDPATIAAVDALMAAYSGDFDLGGTARNVDLLGMAGIPLRAEAGYLSQDNKVYRVMTITLPIIINDAWEQAP